MNRNIIKYGLKKVSSITSPKIIYGVNYRVKGTPGAKKFFTSKSDAEQFAYNYYCEHPTNKPKIIEIPLNEEFDPAPTELYIGIEISLSWPSDPKYASLIASNFKIRYWVKKAIPKINKDTLIKTGNKSNVGTFSLALMRFWSSRYELYFDIPHSDSSAMKDFDEWIIQRIKNLLKNDINTKKGYPREVIDVINQNIL